MLLAESTRLLSQVASPVKKNFFWVLSKKTAGLPVVTLWLHHFAHFRKSLQFMTFRLGLGLGILKPLHITDFPAASIMQDRSSSREGTTCWHMTIMSYACRLAPGILVGVDMDRLEAVCRLTLCHCNLVSLRSLEHTAFSDWKCFLHLSPAGRPRLQEVAHQGGK